MNHDPKYNDFEYEKENYPKTPEHFKQFVAAQVTKELSKASIVKHRARKKYFPAKVAAAVIVCAAVGTTGAYAGVKHYQARSQQYLQETGRITAPGTSSEEETPAISDNADSVSPATIVSEENGLITTFSDTWPDVMLEMYDYDSEYQKQPNQYMNVMDAYYDGGLLSIYGEATPYGIKTLGDWFLPDRIVINDTVYLATWNINGIHGDGCDPQYKRGAFHATVELSDVNLPDTCKVQVPLTTARDPKTGYFYMQTISFDISGNANLKPSVTASSKNGATVTVGESKVSASGTYLSLTWNLARIKLPMISSIRSFPVIQFITGFTAALLIPMEIPLIQRQIQRPSPPSTLTQTTPEMIIGTLPEKVPMLMMTEIIVSTRIFCFQH